MTEKDIHEGGSRSASPLVIKKPAKMIFPVGIFIMLFIVEAIIAAGTSLAYFYYIGRSSIATIETNTRSYAMPVAEAFGTMAEMCYRTKKFDRLQFLFQEKIGQRSIKEAFFVLRDGRVIAHSDPATMERLKGNLAGDELAYNMDLILFPVIQKSRNVFFTDYNIVTKRAPFERQYRMLLKRYFYPNIDSTGWLASRAVYGRKKPVGAVCFIIGKDRVFTFLAAHAERSVGILLISLSVAFAVSLLVTLVVMVRYRSIQKRALAGGAVETPHAFGQESGFYDMSVPPAEQERAGDEEPVVVELMSIPEESSGGDAVAATPFHQRREIKDPIPADDKE
ncbi:MAG: hypothetical protein KA369_24005 [Spirochaetes bacterium]|nr:hypothetical protein [Spirochaetota bacterium]